ncbi:PfkB family carbohydrate kinase [Halobium salinum]|uniref:PfkB family carbohydrate kinase n=1 Tax=Halobium salinum TaxID=1364940 RepID=A0ABD5PCV9_9EURY|nr:PfkB family carbohydrate kinase [Halobium salinum]
MPYDRLRERLDDGLPSPTLTALPDGSVDRYCDVQVGIGADVASAPDLGELIAAGTVGSVHAQEHTERAGGQAVNLADGAHALGADVTLYGLLDHPIHDGYPYETVSMGEPIEILVLEFEEDAFFVANDSEDSQEWTFATLAEAAEAAGRDLDADLTADGVALVNWVSFPGLADAVGEMAERAAVTGGDGDTDGADPTPLLFDAGDVGGSDPDSLDALLDGMRTLSEGYDLLFSANETEARVLGEAAGCDGDDPVDCLRAVAESTDGAAVLHAKKGAVAVEDGETYRLAAPKIEEPDRPTGGGDTFGAALLHARAAGWEWEPSLELANAATSYYVEYGEHAGVDELSEHLVGAELADFEQC